MSLIGFDRRDLDKVLEFLSSFTETIYGKESILNLPILKSISEIKSEQSRIKKIQELINKNCFSIPFLEDIRGQLTKAEKVDFLTEEEAGFIYVNLSTLVFFIERFENNRINEILDISFKYSIDLKDARKELSKFLNEIGRIDEGCSEELRSIIKEKESVREIIVSKLDKLISVKSHILQDKYYTIRDGRYVIPVKVNFKRDLRGTIRDTSQSGDTVFIEPEMISELNNRIVWAEKREEIVKRKILVEITKIIKIYVNQIRESLFFFGYIDSLVARVKYLIKYDLNLIDIEENNDISLYNSYHPLFIDRNFVVKNDFIFPYEKKIFLITGPNGGGKTVSIKTIMMIILLSHMAIPVTASENSKVSFFNNFCFDMEDKQSIESGVSSFTSKMLLWKDILDKLDEKTIIFIDELGNFTNPIEGSAISLTFLEYIVKKGGRVIAGTHIDEIKEYVFSRKDGITGAMLWDEKQQRPTYKISYGSYSGSFAIEVLKKLGFNEEFIKNCEKNLNNDYLYIEELKRKREKEYAEIVELKKSLQEKEQELKRTTEEKRNILKKLEDEKYALIKKWYEEMNTLKNRFEEAIKLLPKDPKLAREFYKAVKNQIDDSIKKINDIKINDSEEIINVGDEVYLIYLNQSGKVIDKDGDNYNVLSGGLKIWVDCSAIRKINDKRKDMVKKKNVVFNNFQSEFVPELDVRGKRLDEAVSIIDKFLDKSHLSGAEKVKIVHGAGEGKLREGIHKFLKENLLVSGFKLGDAREAGGTYYTIVELKKKILI